MDFHAQEHTGTLGSAPHNLAAHRTIYTREHARWHNARHNIPPGLYHHSGPQAPLCLIPNRAYLTLSASKKILFAKALPRPLLQGIPRTHPRCTDHTYCTTTPTNLLPETHPVPSVPSRPLSLSPVPVPADGALGIGACGPGRGRARASLWGGLPRRVPLRRVVPDEAAALRSRTGPAPRLRQPPK